jgi:hypothetical protein
MDTPLETCLERDSTFLNYCALNLFSGHRDKPVGEATIRSMDKKLEKPGTTAHEWDAHVLVSSSFSKFDD